MAECSPGILEDLGLPLSTAEREFTVAVFHALKPALSTGFFGLAFIFVAFIFVVVVVRLFVWSFFVLFCFISPFVMLALAPRPTEIEVHASEA